MISSSSQKKDCRSCTHSKYETVTPACVGDDVRHHGDPSPLEDRVGVRGHGPVRRLEDELRLDAAGVLGGDLVLERRRDQHVDRQLEQLGVADRVGPGKSDTDPVRALWAMTAATSSPPGA